MTKDETLKLALTALEFLHAESLAQDELQNAAIDAIKKVLGQPEQEVSVEVLQAITNAGLTLLKTQHGYELRKLGPAIAHGVK